MMKLRGTRAAIYRLGEVQASYQSKMFRI